MIGKIFFKREREGRRSYGLFVNGFYEGVA